MTFSELEAFVKEMRDRDGDNAGNVPVLATTSSGLRGIHGLTTRIVSGKVAVVLDVHC